jgi:hypothetical protein
MNPTTPTSGGETDPSAPRFQQSRPIRNQVPTRTLRATPCRRRAQIAGLELRELNALEREFLFLLGFRLAVRRDEYDACAATLAAPPLCGPAAPIPPSGSAPPPQPARPAQHHPAAIATVDAAGEPQGHSLQARPEPAATPLGVATSPAGLHRLCIGGTSGASGSDASGSGVGGTRDACGSGVGGTRDAAAPVAADACGSGVGGDLCHGRCGGASRHGPGPAAPSGPLLLD